MKRPTHFFVYVILHYLVIFFLVDMPGVSYAMDILPWREDVASIKKASFNIQVFGRSRADKPEVMATLAKIINEFDIVAIQEIRDSSGTAIDKLEDEVDALGIDYEYVIGPRLGRTSSKEQYAFMYRTDKIEPISNATYEDPDDIFHREPFMAYFKIKNNSFDFVLINIHTDPDEATREINSLTLAALKARELFNDRDIIILGDLNADCRRGDAYFDEEDFSSPLRASDYIWLIPNEADTNIAESDCTYDRIIITRNAWEDFKGEWGVFLFDVLYTLDSEDAKRVSDHYPVWAEFFTDRDTD